MVVWVSRKIDILEYSDTNGPLVTSIARPPTFATSYRLQCRFWNSHMRSEEILSGWLSTCIYIYIYIFISKGTKSKLFRIEIVK